MAPSSYSGAPGADDLVGLVRLLVGDRGPTTFLFTDEEVANVLALQPVPNYAAAVLARSAAATFAAQVNVTTGQTKVELANKSRAYLALALALEASASLVPSTVPEEVGIATPMQVGGISYAANDRVLADSDAVRPAFGSSSGQPLFGPFVTRSEVE